MIQSGKILIFGKKPERSLRVRLFGVGKKFVPLMQGFKNSGKGWGGGKFSPVGWEESEIFLRGGEGIVLLGEGNLRMSDFDDSSLFQTKKRLSVNTEYQLNSKLRGPECPKSMKLKQWIRINAYT